MRTFLLNQLYPKATEGLPLLGTPLQTAAPFRRGDEPLRARAERMIRPHITLAGTTGFVTGLGGFLTMPITVPADLAGVALLQLHLAASCATLAGHDLSDPAVRERVVGCLLQTDEGPDHTVEEETATRAGVKIAERGLRYVLQKSAEWTAKAAGTRLMARRFARGVPLVGGAIGAISDTYSTRVVARHTLDTFFSSGGESREEPPVEVPVNGHGEA